MKEPLQVILDLYNVPERSEKLANLVNKVDYILSGINDHEKIVDQSKIENMRRFSICQVFSVTFRQQENAVKNQEVGCQTQPEESLPNSGRTFINILEEKQQNFKFKRQKYYSTVSSLQPTPKIKIGYIDLRPSLRNSRQNMQSSQKSRKGLSVTSSSRSKTKSKPKPKLQKIIILRKPKN